MMMMSDIAVIVHKFLNITILVDLPLSLLHNFSAMILIELPRGIISTNHWMSNMSFSLLCENVYFTIFEGPAQNPSPFK